VRGLRVAGFILLTVSVAGFMLASPKDASFWWAVGVVVGGIVGTWADGVIVRRREWT
jgi:hypothetical protein